MVTYGRIALVVVFLVGITSNPRAQEYVVNTYDEDPNGNLMLVKTKFINLDTKVITDETTIAPSGYILNRKPVHIRINNSPFLISSVMQGCYCKNSVPGIKTSIVSIIDFQSRQLVFDYSDTNMIINSIVQQDNSIFLSSEVKHPNRRLIKGDFHITGNYQFVLINQHPNSYRPNIFRNLGRFNFYETLDTLRQLYKTWDSENRYVVKTNRSTILDSLRINNNPHRSIVFAVIDSLLYVFHQNFEFYSKFTRKSRDEDRIQSHVIIYNNADFTVLDSLVIPDYPEGEYILDEFDVADVVDDFIVYYFAQPGGLEDYTPAMLFIFDTRTNEATWLRVGWR